MKIRIMAAILLISFIGLAACSAEDAGVPADISTSAKEPSESTEQATVDSIIISGAAPDHTALTQTYDRYVCTVLHEDERQISFDETGELLHEQEAARDAAVERLLDISITNTFASANTMAEETIRRIGAGESVDLLHFTDATTAASLVAGGYLYDIAQSETFSLEHPGLDHTLNASLTIANQAYFLFGDATLTDRLHTAVILVDLEAAAEAAFVPEYCISAVKDGTWTMETWLTMAAQSSVSLDGDAVLPIFAAAGGSLFIKNANDIPVLTAGDAFSRGFAVMQNAMAEGDAGETFVFSVGDVGDILEREGLLALPMPAAEVGKSYRSVIDAEKAECISVPKDPVDSVRTGDILTAYFSQSSDTLSSWLEGALLKAEQNAGGDKIILAQIFGARECLLGSLFGWGELGESLEMAVGMTEAEYLEKNEMRMAVAGRAMEIVLSRLTEE